MGYKDLKKRKAYKQKWERDNRAKRRMQLKAWRAKQRSNKLKTNTK